MKELRLMKGNEAMAEAAIRCGADGYFGYPITPQSEVLEYLMVERPWQRTGMVVLQAESEVASINMLYGGASTGKKVITSSSSPGISLMQEGLSYLAGAELPCVVINVVRGGPGLGDIQPAQSDYFQSVKGGGHGDYNLYVIAPNSVQESSDFVKKAFDIAFKYRIPALILTDGAIGQMMEKVELFEQEERLSDEEVIAKYGSWATTGKTADRERNIITSLDLIPERLEDHNKHLQAKYKEMEENEVLYEEIQVEDAEYVIIAYGTSARISQKTVMLAREKGIKLGLFRPITVWPFPKKKIREYADTKKGLMVVEMSEGQLIEDVKLFSEGRIPAVHFGRSGGVIPTPDEVLTAFEKQFM